MGQDMAVEIIKNAHFPPEIYGKYGLCPPLRTGPAW